MERLNKVLARAGVASRREADRLIRQGRVVVNGSTVDTLGARVDPERDTIRVDGRKIGPASGRRTYLALHKPRGYVTTLSDPEGRPTVRDLMPSSGARLYPVGRLDFNSEGLLILTDDGDLANALMHPRFRVPKTYAVKVRGQPSAETLRRLARGVPVDGRPTLPAEARLARPGRNSWVEITVFEGRKHQVRRMLQAVGHPVVRLRRVRYGGVELGDLPPGECRPLDRGELERLRRAVRDGGHSA